MSELVADVFGAGPAVVLLHGQPGSRHDWSEVVTRLAPEFHVIVPDRPGYGESGGRARGFRGNAAAVAGLLDHLGVGPATVVGHSWAGGVALALAEEAPERLAAMVLVSSVGPGEPISRLDRMLAVPPIGTAVAVSGLFMASVALSLPPLRRAWRHGPDPETTIHSWRSERVWESFVTEQRCLIDELPFLNPGLGAIAAPTIVLVGGADRIVAPTTGRRLARSIPGARLIELGGAGHMLAQHHPDAVADAIRELNAG